MKYFALIFLLIVAASAASTNKQNKRTNQNGVSSRYDVPPGAEPVNGKYD